jgi:hypothetical protein
MSLGINGRPEFQVIYECRGSDPVFGFRNVDQALNSSYEQAVESRVSSDRQARSTDRRRLRIAFPQLKTENRI